MSVSGRGVLVAVFETNMVLSDEANMQAVHVFDRRTFEQSDKSMHEFARPHLEDTYGMVENLRMHPTRVRSVDTDTDQEEV